MSQKFKDRLLQGSGVSNKKYTSDYGSKLLQKMGWQDGNGLGKEQSGISDCVQIQRRTENQGLGKEDNNKFKWNDNWWENTFNSAIQNIQNDESSVGSNNSTSSDEDDSHLIKINKGKKQIKKNKKKNLQDLKKSDLKTTKSNKQKKSK